jgi:hypothetical protein
MVDIINLIPDICYEEPRKTSHYYWSDRKSTVPGIDRIIYLRNPEKEFEKIYKEYQLLYGEITMTKVIGVNLETINNNIIDISSEYLLAIVNGMWEPWEQRDIRYIYRGNHFPDISETKRKIIRLPYCSAGCTFWLTQKGPECKECPPVILGIKEHKKHALARKMVKDAIKSGVISKPNKCEVCHETKPVEAHHNYYDEQLIVLWLCRKCHNEITFGKTIGK